MINPVLVLAFSVLSAPTTPTLDASYVFRVPVRIENMRHVTRASVSCNIILDRPGSTPIGVGTTGPEMVWTPVTDGALTDTVTITVTLSSTVLATGTPVRWSCGLTYDFRNPDGTIVHSSFVEGERERVYTRSTGQEITTAVVTVGGPLPPP